MSTVLFRVDASIEIGIGHVMRCLALAGGFEAKGWSISFAATANTYKVCDALGKSAYQKYVLDEPEDPYHLGSKVGPHCDLAVVDHYGLDHIYERTLKDWVRCLLVIDDLANRPHEADVLADSTPGRTQNEYRALVPNNCNMMLGTDYAMLRPEFSEARSASLMRRKQFGGVERILISVGGTDPLNITATAYEGVRQAGFQGFVDVVLAQNSQYLKVFQDHADKATTIHAPAKDMAILMRNADIAIGAPGTTSWERCCLGLPALLTVTAENQRTNAHRLSEAGAIVLLKDGTIVTPQDVAESLTVLLTDANQLYRMSKASAQLCDGRGVDRVIETIERVLYPN